MARVVVADAEPLIAFAAVDRLNILHSLFSRLTITESVKSECLAKPGPDAQRIAAALDAGWLVAMAVESSSETLSISLGQGETDSIHLALQDPTNTLLILDDRLARRQALRRRLNLVGSARLLLLAEQRGLLDSADDVLAAMADNGYRISSALLDDLRAANMR